MAMRHFAITQRGESHIRQDTVCQDYSGAQSVELPGVKSNCVVAAISDGVGSCLYSDEGSRIAVTTVLERLSARMPALEKICGETVLAELRAAFHAALDAIEKHSGEEEKPMLELDCTLTAVVFMEDGRVFYGHIGDDGVVVMFEDGSSRMLSMRHKGEESNSVYPLPIEEMWEFGEADKPVASVAMMTDGVLDRAVGGKSYGNRVYLPMIKTALTFPMLDEEAAQQLHQHWHNYLLDPAFRERMADDITLVTLQRPEAVAALPEVVFDQAEWDALAEAEKERVRRVLSEEAEALKKEQEERGTVTTFEELSGDAQLTPMLVGMPAEESESVDESAESAPAASAEAQESAEDGGSQTQTAPAGNSGAAGGVREAGDALEPDATNPTPPAEPDGAKTGSAAQQTGAGILREMKDGWRRFVQDVRSVAKRATAAPLPGTSRVLTGMNRRQYSVGRRLLKTNYGMCYDVDADPNVLLVLLDDGCFDEKSMRTSRSALEKRMQALCQNVGQRSLGAEFVYPAPCDVLCDESGRFVGYAIDCPDNNVHTLEQVWLEKGPDQYYGRWQFRDWVYVSIVLTAMVARMHRQGMRIFDFDPQNFMVRKGAQVGMLRMDRICFTDQKTASQYQPCSARMDMLAPEVIYAAGKKMPVPCNAETESFSFAVLLYMLLTGGRHPFDVDNGSDMAQNILTGSSVYSVASSLDKRPPAFAVELEELFRRAFVYDAAKVLQAGGNASRPGLQEWIDVLQAVRRRG